MATRLLSAAVFLLAACRVAAEPPPSGPALTTSDAYHRPTGDELRRRLTPLAYEVTQNAETEPPFRNAFWDHHAAGIYVDVVTGEPLFSSRDKFDSGTGWPSFTRPIESGHVRDRVDHGFGADRVEVRSAAGDSHLGHVFDDGPPPTGQRYCINSASLRFVPAAQLEAAGYPQYAAAFAQPGVVSAKLVSGPKLETAILAGGCFWGMEEILRKIPGVITTEVGYAQPAGGGDRAEAVKVTFDPAHLGYADLLEKWYFRMHDPTTANRQGNDVGAQYRSALFVRSAEQRSTATAVKTRVDASHKWPRPVVTQIVDAGAFTRAEEGHQRYLEKNPGGYTCHYLRD